MPRRKIMKKLMEDFKSFALKGNVIDLAVGIIIGGAFGKIVSSLVSDIIMPLFSLITGRMDIVNLKYIVVEKTATVPESAIRYGVFIQTILDFLIIAFSIFMVIKVFSKFKKKQEEKVPAVAAPNAQEVLLTEIRDLLKNK
jgi:large conductance mechanosensitive channel